MCDKPQLLICGAVALTDIVILLILFAAFVELYQVKDDRGAATTHLKHGAFKTTLTVRHTRIKMKLSDPYLQDTGVAPYKLRMTLTIAFLFITVGLCVIVVILAFLDCCHVVDLTSGGAWIALLVLSIVIFGSAFATAIIPTLEYVHESGKFNTVATRPESFWGKVLAKMASGDEFPPGDNVMISRDLQSPTLRVKLGWVIYLIWVGSGFALGAVVLIVLAAPRRHKKQPKKYTLKHATRKAQRETAKKLAEANNQTTGSKNNQSTTPTKRTTSKKRRKKKRRRVGTASYASKATSKKSTTQASSNKDSAGSERKSLSPVESEDESDSKNAKTVKTLESEEENK